MHFKPLYKLIYRVPCAQVLDNAIETEKMIEKYESLASDLLEWIEQTIIILNNRKFANSLVGVQQQLQAFNTYRTVEKPPKWVSTSAHFAILPYSWAVLFDFNMILVVILRSAVPLWLYWQRCEKHSTALKVNGHTVRVFQRSKWWEWSDYGSSVIHFVVHSMQPLWY